MTARLAKDQIITRVRGLTPTTSPLDTFVCLDDADGPVPPLEERAAGGAVRHFDIITLSGPVDDGQAGVTSLRYAEGLQLRVTYPAGFASDRAERDRIISEDTVSIVGDLRQPDNWVASIDTLNIGLRNMPAPITIPVGDNEPNAPAVMRLININLLFTT